MYTNSKNHIYFAMQKLSLFEYNNKITFAKRYFIVVVLFINIITFGCHKGNIRTNQKFDRKTESSSASSLDLNRFLNERQNFTSKYVYKYSAPQEYTNDVPPDGVEEITYPSGNLNLKAWITENPNDGKRYPALVFLHGGFSHSIEDWDEMAKRYVDAGFVVMMPALRGENGNPGGFQLFYGELDDVIAAGNYISKLDYVDATNIFVAGHSVGGTLSVLASMVPSKFNAAASFGASPDISPILHLLHEVLPFEPTNKEEVRIRNPMDHVDCVQIPLRMYVGKDDEYIKDTKQFEQLGLKTNRPVSVEILLGDHFTSVDAAIQRSINYFLENSSL